MTASSSTPEPHVAPTATSTRRALVAAAAAILILAFAASVAFGRTDGSSTEANAPDAPPPSSSSRPTRAASEPSAIGQKATHSVGPLPLPYTDPNATIQVFDHGTGQLVIFTEKQWYDAALPYMPHPAGSLVASVYLENGIVKPQYYERIVTFEERPEGRAEVGASGREVPFEEAQLRVEEEWRTLPPIPGLQRP